MQRFRLIAPALSLGLLAAGLIVVPAQAADRQTAAPAFTPTLAYEACPPGEKLPAGTRCAKLTVPLDWQTPDDGRTTEIAMRVVRSKQRGGGLTFNPGGPGASGIDFTAAIYSELPATVRDRFDYVAWDPRGVGLSGPTLNDCNVATDVDLPPTGPVDWQAFWEAQLAFNAELNTACLAGNPDAAPYLGTWQVVRDLEAMRIALGYKQWNYWGMSYGTRIGHAYARTFPTSLRALIMDGSVMAGETLYRFGTTYPAGLEVSQQVYASIAGRAQAHKLDVIFDYLDDDTIPTTQGDLTRWGFASSLKNLLGQQATYPFLRAQVNNLYNAIMSTRSATRARALREAGEAWLRIPRANSEQVTLVLINCADLHDRPTASQLATASMAAERQYGTASPLWSFNASICAGLPADMSPASPSDTSLISLATPPMFVLSTGDSATPWIWGRSMANTFARSRTISYASTQHVTYMQTPSACVNDPVTTYLLTLRQPSRDISCGFTPSPPPPPQ